MSSESSETPLDWQQQIKDWSEKVSYIKNEGVLTDCEFSVGKGNSKKTIRAHKLILAMQSPVFEKMFFGSLSKTDRIDVPDIDSNIFESMIGWMYTSKISLTSVQEAIDTVYAANKYLLSSLIHECSEYLQNNISAETAVQYYQAICESPFKDMYLDKLDHAAALVFEDPQFVTMKREALSAVLDRDVLNVKNEVEVYEAVMKWATSECLRQGLEVNGRNQRKVLEEDIVGKIRFHSFTMEEFSKLVGSSDLLTADEKLALFNCIACPETCQLTKCVSANASQRARYNKVGKCLYGDKAEEKIIALADAPSDTPYRLDFSALADNCVLRGLVLITYVKGTSSAPFKLQPRSRSVSIDSITKDSRGTILSKMSVYTSQLQVNPRHWWGDIFMGDSSSSGLGLTIVSFPSSVSLHRQISYRVGISGDQCMYCSDSALRSTSPLAVHTCYDGCVAGFVLSACNGTKFTKDGYQMIHPDIPAVSLYHELANFEKGCKCHEQVRRNKTDECLYSQKPTQQILSFISSPSTTSPHLAFSVKAGECVLSGVVIITYAKDSNFSPLKVQLSSMSISLKCKAESEGTDDKTIFSSQPNVNPRHWWGDIFVGVSSSSGFGLSIVRFPSSVTLDRQKYLLEISDDRCMYSSKKGLCRAPPLFVDSEYRGCVAGFVLSACNGRKFTKDEYQMIHPDIPTMNFYSELTKFEEECKPLKRGK